MKKKKNIRVAALVMIFTMFFGVTAQTTYAKEINTIDFEYYSQTLISEYAKYGIEIEMEPVEGFVYTQELLEFELAKVEDYADQYLRRCMQLMILIHLFQLVQCIQQ